VENSGSKNPYVPETIVPLFTEICEIKYHAIKEVKYLSKLKFYRKTAIL
jgi:hypothetical protein